MAQTKRQPSDEPPVPAAVRPAYEAILGQIEAFFREHLNAEYEALSFSVADCTPGQKWFAPGSEVERTGSYREPTRASRVGTCY